MRMAILTLALMSGSALGAFAQESRVRLNPYAGWYHFDEGSFEEGFDTSETESDPIYGLRLGLGTGRWTLDLAYGRTTIGVEVPGLEGTTISDDATIQLFYAALNWHLPLTGPLDLFLSGGGGGIDTAFDDGGSETDVLLNYGLGAAIPMGSLRLRADLKDQVDLCNEPEELEADFFAACFEDDALHNIELTAGVEIPL
ncbi:MAG TPA: hypothetical protein VFQ21_02050 [Gemmatimonadota bacterium]|nr:hypothetical protein [Gemmatimonadota bacterium]